MALILLIVRLLLALVFLIAGAAKLADRPGSRQALVDFGVPARLASSIGVLMPLAEVLVSIALIPIATAWWGALAALALLVLFVGGISYNLSRGRTPDCHCFGQLHSAPAGKPTLVRNGVLAAMAGFVVWQGADHPGLSVVGWLGTVTAIQLASLVGGLLLLGVVVGEGWLLLNLLRQNGRLLLRVEALEARLEGRPEVSARPPAPASQGLPVGTPAPSFQLASLDDELLTLDTLRSRGKPVLLVFSDPECGPCTALLPDLARWQHTYRDKLSVALVSRGTSEANRFKVAEHELAHVLLQQDREVAQSYQAHATPTGVIVNADGTIGSPLAPGSDAIAALVARTVGTLPPHPRTNGHGAMPAALPIGAPAPALTLPALDGPALDLSAFRGHPTLLLFWNPGCGFCQRMLDDLKAWEARSPQGAPQLLVVSTGSVEANQAMELQSPIVLDQQFAAGRQFGASGTPSAVLLDAEGRLASQVAVGAQAVLALANDPHQIRLTSV